LGFGAKGTRIQSARVKQAFAFPPTCGHERDQCVIPNAAWRLSANADVQSRSPERPPLDRKPPEGLGSGAVFAWYGLQMAALPHLSKFLPF
jgi:hypothetical protein